MDLNEFGEEYSLADDLIELRDDVVWRLRMLSCAIHVADQAEIRSEWQRFLDCMIRLALVEPDDVADLRLMFTPMPPMTYGLPEEGVANG